MISINWKQKIKEQVFQDLNLVSETFLIQSSPSWKTSSPAGIRTHNILLAKHQPIHLAKP